MSINCKSYADLETEAQAVDGFTLDFRRIRSLQKLAEEKRGREQIQRKAACDDL